MAQVQAFDVNGRELQEGQYVLNVTEPTVKHAWLRKGNVLRVTYWETITIFTREFVSVF